MQRTMWGTPGFGQNTDAGVGENLFQGKLAHLNNFSRLWAAWRKTFYLILLLSLRACVCACVCACTRACLVAQSCPSLCDPMDCSPPGSSVHGDSPEKNDGVGCYVLLQLGVLQFSSVAKSCPTLCDPMNSSTPGLPVLHQLLEFTQTHVHRVSDAIQPSISSSVIPFSSCPQSLPASESFPMSQLFAWGGQSTGVSALASFPPEMQNKNNNKVTLHTCLNGYHQNIYK